MPSLDTEVLRLDPGTEQSLLHTSLFIRCFARSGPGDFFCSGSYGGLTRYVHIGGRSAAVARVGAIQGRTWRDLPSEDGRFYTWLDSAEFAEIDPEAGRAERLDFGRERLSALSLAVASDRAAVISRDGGRGLLTLHRLR
jgi:hypothetical protein